MKPIPIIQWTLSLSLFLACWLSESPCPVFAQTDKPPTAQSTTQPVEENKERDQALTAEIDSVSSALSVLGATGDAELKNTLQRRFDLLSRIRLSYIQQDAALQAQQSLTETRTQVEGEVQESRFPKTTGAPVTFLALDKMQENLFIERGRQAALKGKVDSRQSALSDAKKTLEGAEQQRRQTKDLVATTTDPTQTPLLSEKILTAQVESRSASETVHLRELELANEKLDLEIFQLRLTILENKVKWWKERIRFNPQDLQEILSVLDRRVQEMEARKQIAESERLNAETRLARATERFDAAVEPDQALKEELEARRFERVTRQREVVLLGERLQHLAEMRKAWERRFKVINYDATPTEIKEWAKETTAQRAQCDLDHPPQMALVDDLRRDLRSLEEKGKAETNQSPPIQRWIGEQKRYLENRIRLEEEHGLIFEEAWRLYVRFIEEINVVQSSWNLIEWFHVVANFALSIWNKELIESTDNPLTVKKLVIALILFALGLYVSRRLTNSLNQRLLQRLPLPSGTSSILKSLAYYLLLLLSTVIALKVANVPLTLFAFLGGALAIGIGFGSQQIINNFISGLILLIERPVQEGDQIEYLVGNIGTVIRIGPRCTHIRTGANVDIFIPNSTLLQANVINWTRTDDKVRVQINVPVQYGASTRDVAKLLRRSVDEHGKVMKKPEPLVLLKEFGLNGFEFQVHFWIQMIPGTDRNTVESDIRFIIENHFRESGILMPYPQRELHWDSSRVIQVEVREK